MTSDIYSNTVSVSLGDGRGGFSATETGWSGGDFPLAVAVADFVGDGRLDLAIANRGSGGAGDLAISYNLEPPSWWPSWATGAWPTVLAQWASAAWPSWLRPWDLNAWLPQPAIDAWSSVASVFGFSAGVSAHRHAHRTAPLWLHRLATGPIPAWLTPRTVSRWAAAAERRAHHVALQGSRAHRRG